VQEDIARAVAGALKVKLLTSQARTPSARAPNPEAHQSYLQGRFFLAQGNRENLSKAVESFERATRLQPDYAAAWASLGESRSSQAGLAYIPTEDGYRQAREDVTRALSLDPNLGAAHAALAEIRMIHDWDWRGASASYERALELEPGNATILRGLASLRRIQGRLDESITFVRRAIEIDPLRSNGYKSYGMAQYYAGQLDEAAHALDEAIQLSPSMGVGHSLLAEIYIGKSEPERARAEAEKEPHPAFQLSATTLANFALGSKKNGDAGLAEMINEHSGDAPYLIARLYAFQGQVDPAVKWLARSYRDRDPGLAEIKCDPLLKNIRSDSRFVSLLREMHLAE
jgi:tetratricopeptide (TPR) repeat protein